MSGLNRLFWAFFAILGLVMIVQFFNPAGFLDLAVGFLVIAIGVLKLSEELQHRTFEKDKKELSENIRYLTNWLDNNQHITNMMKIRHESRFHHMDSKRADLDQKIEDSYRDVVKKIVGMENRLSDVIKVVVQSHKKLEETDRKIHLLDGKMELVRENITLLKKRKF